MRVIFVAMLACIAGAFGHQLQAATIAPAYSADYSLTSLGSPGGVPGLLGGVTLLAGDNNTLLIGGNANNASGAIYSIGVIRDANNHITGFSGPASFYAAAPYIDGGLSYGPGGVLFYTGYSTNQLGQIKPGSVAPDKVVSLSGLGVAGSVGALAFVPAGFPGAGNVVLGSYSASTFYTTSLTADGSGTYDVNPVANALSVPGGPEGIIYVPNGSTGFAHPSMLVSEYAANRVSAYEVDANGLPIVSSRSDFITGLTGAEGAFIDPLTGDFLFSTFGGGNQVFVVQGFAAPPTGSPVPEPASLALLGIGAFGCAAGYRRRRVPTV